MKIKFTILSCFLSMVLHCQTETLKDLKSLQEFKTKVATSFLNLEFDKTFEMLENHWPLPDNEIDSLKMKTLKFKSYFQENFGKPLNVVKIKEVNLKDVLYKEVYAVRFENFILRLILKSFYLKDKWVISTFEWDDQIQLELDK